jgi:hypothetical protein
MGGAIFVGRANETNLVQSAVNDLLSDENCGAKTIHIHGPKEIGKTALIRELKSTVGGERIAVLSLSFADPYGLDPFTQLLRLRKALKSSIEGFECDAFDAAALLFDCNFRDGLLTQAQLRDGSFAAGALLEEGIKEAVGEGGKGWLTAAASAGAGAGASAAAVSGAAGLLAQALVAGVAGIGAFGACILLKGLGKGIFKRVKDKRLLKNNPELRGLMNPGEADYEAFEEALPLLLARAVEQHRAGSFGYLPCLLLDPADALGGRDEAHGLVKVGQWLSKVLDGIEKKLVVATSRETTERWAQQVAAQSTLPSLPLTSCGLGPLQLTEVRTWLDREGFADATLPTKVVCADGAGIRPKEFFEWARRLSSSEDGPNSRASEDQTV